MSIYYTEVAWRTHAERLQQLRREVFVDEQQVPEEDEWDGLDDEATHFLAITDTGTDLGCARLLPTGQIGRMAVRADARGQGIGAELLELAVNTAQQQGFDEVFLHAQVHAEAFYRKAQFLVDGAPFDESGIEHVHMTRKLSLPVDAPKVTVPSPTPSTKPQQRADGVMFDTETHARQALIEGLALARRELIIYSHVLAPEYFDEDETVQRISAFSRRAANCRVRVLIHNSKLIVSRGHRLVDLCQRVPSKCNIRLVDPDYDPPDSCFVAWDETGLWQLPDYRDTRGVLQPEDPVRSKRLFRTFEVLWQRAKIDPNLRVLRL